MPPRKKARAAVPALAEAATGIEISIASNISATSPSHDFENLTVAQMKTLLADAGVVCDNKIFKKRADYIVALQALPAPVCSSPPDAPSLPPPAAPVTRASVRARPQRYPSEDNWAGVEVEASGSVRGHIPVSAVQASPVHGLSGLADDDGSDDGDGPQCLADILPAPQRAKLSAVSHKAAMFIATADVQLLFSSMARDTLKKGTVGRKGKGHLDAEAQRIMGLANIEFAMGNFEKSKELCLRVVQLQPHSTQPYSTLSSIYESSGDIRRATDYLLCAAVVKPRNPDIWIQLSTKFQELGQLKSAIHCLQRASSNKRDDLNLLWMRFELQTQLHVDGNYRLSLDTLETILRRGLGASSDNPLDPLVKTAAMRLAFEHHKNGKLENAANVLRSYVQATEARDAADYDACNLLAECMVMQQEWQAMFDLLCNLRNRR
jgi:tetratricopeptide (TPR) repeat protein